MSEFLTNSGSFETPYLDDDLRISRSKVGIVDVLRVFVKKMDAVVEEDVVAETAEQTMAEQSAELDDFAASEDQDGLIDI